MTTVFALIRKNLLDIRWMLLLISATLFWLCWLFVFIPRRMEQRGRFPAEVSSIRIEMGFWDNNPLLYLLIALWAISRGSAVAGEVEKGTMDLILSRPVTRFGYLSTHVFVAVLGLLIVVGSMVAGNQASAHFNILKTPPDLLTLLKPALNLAAFGWAVYGYTFLASSFDFARWRPILIGSVLTLAGFIAHLVSLYPTIDENWKMIDRLSIFRACKLVEVATTGETLAFNVSVLGGIGAIGVIIGYVVFAYRDLPAGS